MQKRDFDKDAVTWDDSPTRVKLAEDVAGAVLRLVKLTPEMDAVDFGCGTGLLTLRLRPFVRSITGVDSSRGMLEVLSNKIQAQGIHNVSTVLLDLSGKDSLPGRYHAIVSSMTLHHMEDIRGILSQFYKALLSGGQIAVADLDEEGGRFHEDNAGVFHFGFNREKLRNLFLETGFADVTVTTAAEVHKPGQNGDMRIFTVFLIKGVKH